MELASVCCPAATVQPSGLGQTAVFVFPKAVFMNAAMGSIAISSSDVYATPDGQENRAMLPCVQRSRGQSAAAEATALTIHVCASVDISDQPARP